MFIYHYPPYLSSCAYPVLWDAHVTVVTSWIMIYQISEKQVNIYLPDGRTQSAFHIILSCVCFKRLHEMNHSLMNDHTQMRLYIQLLSSIPINQVLLHTYRYMYTLPSALIIRLFHLKIYKNSSAIVYSIEFYYQISWKKIWSLFYWSVLHNLFYRLHYEQQNWMNSITKQCKK